MKNTDYLGVIGALIESDHKNIIFPLEDINKDSTICYLYDKSMENNKTRLLKAVVKTENRLCFINYSDVGIEVITYLVKNIKKIAKTVIHRPNDCYDEPYIHYVVLYLDLCDKTCYVDLKRPEQFGRFHTDNFDRLITALEREIGNY